MTKTQLYFSREERVPRTTLNLDPKEIDFEKVEEEIGREADALIHNVISFNDELNFYFDTLCAASEHADREILDDLDEKYGGLAYRWGKAQVALSRVAKALGIDGNMVFQEALDESE